MSKLFGRLFVILAAMGIVAHLSANANANILLFDDFNDGNIATNTTGVGTGFGYYEFYNSGGSATESGGLVTLSGPEGNWATIQSNDALNPIGVTTTWVIASKSPNVNYCQADVGWAKLGLMPTQEDVPQLNLQFRTDRFVMDIMWPHRVRPITISSGSTNPNQVYTWDGTEPITVSLTTNADGWQVDAHSATMVDIHMSGVYPESGSITDLYAAGMDRVYLCGSHDAGSWSVAFDRVSVTAVPEPGTLALLGAGLIGLLCYAWKKRK